MLVSERHSKLGHALVTLAFNVFRDIFKGVYFKEKIELYDFFGFRFIFSMVFWHKKYGVLP